MNHMSFAYKGNIWLARQTRGNMRMHLCAASEPGTAGTRVVDMLMWPRE